MERLTKWNESSYKHAYYPRCFKEPRYGSGCKIKDCPFEIAVCERLAAYEDTGLTPKEVTALGELFDYALKESKTLTEQLALLNRIRDLAEADRDGRLVVPPCKAGDTVYEVTSRKTISEYRVKAIRVELFCTFIEWDIVAGFVDKSIFGVPVDEIGKTVFLTREEAKKALEAMK